MPRFLYLYLLPLSFHPSFPLFFLFWPVLFSVFLSFLFLLPVLIIYSLFSFAALSPFTPSFPYLPCNFPSFLPFHLFLPVTHAPASTPSVFIYYVLLVLHLESPPLPPLRLWREDKSAGHRKGDVVVSFPRHFLPCIIQCVHSDGKLSGCFLLFPPLYLHHSSSLLALMSPHFLLFLPLLLTLPAWRSKVMRSWWTVIRILSLFNFFLYFE